MLVEDGPELSPIRRRPPEVQLFRTLLADIRGWYVRLNHRVEFALWVFHGAWLSPRPERGGWRPGNFDARLFAESRIAAQNWRPSCDDVALVDIVERHTEPLEPSGSTSTSRDHAVRCCDLDGRARGFGGSNARNLAQARSSSVMTLRTRLLAIAKGHWRRVGRLIGPIDTHQITALGSTIFRKFRTPTNEIVREDHYSQARRLLKP